MNNSTFYLLLLVVFFFNTNIKAGVNDKTDKVITIAGSPWQPFYGEDLKDYGLISKIVTESFKHSGYKVKFYFIPWARCLVEIEAGRIDATPIAYYTDERAKIFYYSLPFMESPIVFFKHVDSQITWKTLKDLIPYRIGVGIKIAYSPEFDKTTFLDKVEIPNDLVNLQRIALKRIDLAPLDKYVGIYYLINKYPHLKDQIEILQPPLYSHKLYVLFSRKIKNPKRKIKAFNDGYQKIIKNGIYQSILNEYSSTQLTQNNNNNK